MRSGNRPRISIGMPVYNGERYVDETLRHITGQTFDDFELIISDNGSTDRTMEIVRNHAARDGRIIVRSNERNLGAAPNYNVLVSLARGSYFKWAAHDDLLAPGYLDRCMAHLDAHPGDLLCYPSTIMIDADGARTGLDPWDVLDVSADTPHERFARFLAAAWPRLGCNAVFGLIRLDFLKQTRLIGSYASSDKILLAELAMLGRFHQLEERLFYRREHAGSSVRAHPGLRERNQWFDAAAEGPGFIHWRWVGELLRGIGHVPIGAAERLRCAAEVRRHVSRDRDGLIAELKAPVKQWIGRTPAGGRATR